MANFLIAYNSSAMNPSLVIPTDEFELLSYTVRNVGVDGIVLESILSLKEAHEYQIIPCFSSVHTLAALGIRQRHVKEQPTRKRHIMSR